MQPNDTTPRFKNLSINGGSTVGSIYENEPTDSHKPENGCFMCRQANIYLNPIGMQRERRVARRHPPPLSRAQIEELSEKKHLTKREVRSLLQCYFPEIKNVKYFQLHKFHSCCYDPKHMNLCKNHITALQHERADHGQHAFHKHKDEDHFKEYETNNGHQNRVSFVRIKIEPTKGIPTRFLGPTALPESLADMLIKQVNRFENKKRRASFTSDSQTTNSVYNIKRIGQVHANAGSTASDYLRHGESDDDDDDEFSEDELGDDGYHPNTASSNIFGHNGKSRDHSRAKREKKPKASSERQTSTNGDLVVEDVEDLAALFVVDTETGKKKKARKRIKRSQHTKPKLNHWEQLALEQSKQESCGCRHHVRRFEADQIVYDWCRCKDHLHQNFKVKQKESSEQPPATTPPVKKPKPAKKKIIPPSKTEMALAYDPTTIDYDVIQEVLYFRTSSGRLVKPEISNSLAFNDSLKARGMNPYKSYTKLPTVSLSPSDAIRNEMKRTPLKQQSAANSPIFFTEDPLSDSNTNLRAERTTSTTGLITVREVRESPIPQFDGFFSTKGMTNTKTNDKRQPEIEEEEEEEEEEDDYDDDANAVTKDFVPPKYLPQNPDARSTPSPTTPLRMQKSSKPTFKNHRPTPNFERETSLLANRRWYDQALGDQNLSGIHDGQFGLIASSSAQDNDNNEKLPDNNRSEPDNYTNRSNCTIS